MHRPGQPDRSRYQGGTRSAAGVMGESGPRGAHERKDMGRFTTIALVVPCLLLDNHAKGVFARPGAFGFPGMLAVRAGEGELCSESILTVREYRRLKSVEHGKNIAGTGKRDAGFLSTHTAVYNAINRQRHLISRRRFKIDRAAAFAQWRASRALPEIRSIPGRCRPDTKDATMPYERMVCGIERV